MDKIQKLKQWISQSNRIVFFGGAGVSTESGIPDFRSVDGLYSQKFDYPPETIISHTFYERKPDYFFRFYREKMLPLGFEPNITHKVLAKWEEAGKLSAVVTQNIDGLHQKAGSKRVYELHGSVLRNAAAAERSSRMWCCMRNRWIRIPLRRASAQFIPRICSSLPAPA